MTFPNPQFYPEPVIDGIEFPVFVDEQGRKAIEWSSRPWEEGDPEAIFSVGAFPITGGLGSDRLGPNPDTYGSSFADASWGTNLYWPPQQAHSADTGGAFRLNHPIVVVAQLDAAYVTDSEKVYKIANLSTTMSPVTVVQTLPAFNQFRDIILWENQLLVTSTQDIGAGGPAPNPIRSMTIPGEVWTTGPAGTEARTLGIKDNLLFRGAYNKISSISAGQDPLVPGNWIPTSGSEYVVGNERFQILKIIDYYGALWVGKEDGVYQADPNFVFHNQTPQLALTAGFHPDSPDNWGPAPRGMFVGHGYLWVPGEEGTLRISPGESIPFGPEKTYRPDFTTSTINGVAWGDSLFISAYSQWSGPYPYTIMRGVRQPDGSYIWHDFIRDEILFPDLPVGMTIVLSTSGIAGIPYFLWTSGTQLHRVRLGSGASRWVDSGSYNFGTNMSFYSGLMRPGQGDRSLVFVPLGVRVEGFLRPGDTLAVSVLLPDGTVLRCFKEGTTDPVITDIDPAVSLYVEAQPSGSKFFQTPFQFKIEGTLGSAANGMSKPYVRSCTMYGHVRPRSTDVVKITFVASDYALNTKGMGAGKGKDALIAYFRDRLVTGHSTVQLNYDYISQTANTSKSFPFTVASVAWSDAPPSGVRGELPNDNNSYVTVTMYRMVSDIPWASVT